MLLINSIITTAHARTAESACLAAFRKRTDQVYYLDPGLEDAGACILLEQGRRRTMNGIPLLKVDRAALIHGFADHIKDPAKDSLTHWNRDCLAGGVDRHPALQAVSRRHCNCPNPVVAQLLLHFENKLLLGAIQFEVHLERFENLGQLGSLAEIGVNNGANDLNNSSLIHAKFIPTPVERW
jgi:hypothetical protein